MRYEVLSRPGERGTRRRRRRATALSRRNRWIVGAILATALIALVANSLFSGGNLGIFGAPSGGWKTPAYPDAPQAKHPLRVARLANHGVILATGARTVVIDGLLDRPNPAYPAPPAEILEALLTGAPPYGPVDLVLVTRNHPDHFATGVVARLMASLDGVRLVAPRDAVDILRQSTPAFQDFADRVVSVDLLVGEAWEGTVAGVRLKALRTLHSGERESPMNLMYMMEMDGRVVFHEGASSHLPENLAAATAGWPPIDLALVHLWFPFQERGRRLVEKVLRAGAVGLGHFPLDGGAPGPEAFEALDDRYFLLHRPGEWRQIGER